jgi:translocation and assembly module TamB
LILGGIILVGLLQTRWGRDQARDIIEAQVNDQINGTIHIGALEGDILDKISAHNVVVTQGQDTVATALHLNADYVLWNLWYNEVWLKDVHLEQSRLFLKQLPDSSWNIEHLLKTKPKQKNPTKQNIYVEHIRVEDVNIRAVFYPASKDSVAEVKSLDWAGKDIRYEEKGHEKPVFSGRIENLTSTMRLPKRTDDLNLAFAGAINQNEFQADTLSVQSALSHVTAKGVVSLPKPNQPNRSHFDLNIAPFAFREVASFAPFLNPDEVLNGTAKIRVEGNRYSADVKGQFKHGASYDLVTDLSLDTNQPVSYSAKGTLRGFNAAYLTGRKDFDSNFNADIDIALAGTKPESLYGDAIINVLDGTRWQNRKIKAGVFDNHFEDGELRFSARSGVDEVAFDATGMARLFDETPTYSAKGSFANVEVTKPEIAAFIPKNIRLEGKIGGTFDVKGSGTSVEGVTLNSHANIPKAVLTLTDIGIPRLVLPLTNVASDVHLQGNNVTFNLDTKLFSGSQLRTKGNASWDNLDDLSTLRFQVEQGTLKNLNLREMLGEKYARTDISSDFSLSGKGTNPKTMFLHLDTKTQSSTYDIYSVQNGQFSAELNNGLLTYSTQSNIGAYQNNEAFVSMRGNSRPFAERPNVNVTEGRFTNMKLDNFMPDSDTRSNFNGHFTFQAEGTSLETLKASSAVWLDESRYQDYILKEGTGTFTLARKKLDYDFDLWTDSGKIALRGDANPFEETPRFRLERGEFRKLNLAAFTKQKELQSDLNGWVRDVVFEGKDQKNFHVSALIDLEKSQFNRQSIERGTVRVLADPASMDMVADLFFQNADGQKGQAHLVSKGKIDGLDPVYSMKGRITNVDIPKLLGMKTEAKSGISLNLAIEGRGIMPESMQLKGTVSGRKSFYEGIHADSLLSHFDFADGRLQMDTLSVIGNVLNVQGKGKIIVVETFSGEESDFNFQANLKDLTALNTVLPAHKITGNGAVQGSIRGEAGAWRLRMDTIGDGLKLLRFDDVLIGKAQGRFLTEFDQSSPVYTTNLKVETFSIPGYVFQNGRAEVSLKDSLVTFDGSAVLDDRFKGEGAGTVTLGKDAYILALSHFKANVGTAIWQMEGSSTLTYSENVWGVEDLRLVSGKEMVFINGYLDQEDQQSLTVDLKDFDFSATADLLKLKDLGGIANGSLHLNGSPQKMTMDGILTVPNLLSYNRVVGALNVKMDYRDTRLNVDATFAHTEGQKITAKGFLPFNLGTSDELLEGNVQFQILTNNLNLDWVNPFLYPDMFKNIGGRLTCDLNIGGTFQSPDFQGTAQLRQAQMDLLPIGTHYEKADADISFEHDKAKISRLIASTGAGNLQGTGTISLATLDLGYFDLDLKANNFQLINTDTYRGAATGTAKLRGTTERPILDGDVVLNQFEIFLNSELMQTDREVVRLSEKDIQQVEATFGKQVAYSDTTTISFYDATDVKLKARSNGNVWLRSRYNPRMDIEMTGDIDFTKPYRKAEYITGNLEAVAGRSKVEFVRRFDITKGSIKFNGEMLNPDMDITAQYTARSGTANEEQKILMKITGDVEDMKFSFESEPPRSDAEIISYLAFGQDTQTSFSKNLGSYTYSLIESLVAQQAQQLGIADVVELTEQDGAPSVKIGRYFGRRFFVALNSKLQSENGLGAIVEYQAKKWALLRLQSDKTTSFYVLLEYSY